MVPTILRRGGAWRIAALAVLAASILSFGAGRPSTVSAHIGEGLCSNVDTPVAEFLFWWTDWFYYPAPHYHRWWVAGYGEYDAPCGYEI